MKKAYVVYVGQKAPYTPHRFSQWANCQTQMFVWLGEGMPIHSVTLEYYGD